jgi:hypothetical protein
LLHLPETKQMQALPAGILRLEGDQGSNF